MGYNGIFSTILTMKKLLIILFIFNLSACNNQQDQQLPLSQAVAIVGGQTVTVDLLNAFLLANGVSQPDEATLKVALEKLAEEVAIANIASKKEIDLTREQLNTLEYLRIKSMASNARKDYLSTNEITEAEIQDEYDKVNSQMGGKEYRLHHLLYKDEVQAIKQRETIKSVEDYKVLEYSFMQENPNNKGVGDIGWVSLTQLPKGISEVLPTMADNTLLTDVVNTQFGAHIVYLEATRSLQPPKLEEVKPGIIKSLQAKKLSKFSQLARAKARIEIKK